MGYVGRGLNQTGGQYRKIDDISSGFDGSETSFTLKVSGVDITPTAQNVLISINGVIQEPGSAYSMNGSTITFTGAPDGAANFFGIVMGEASYIAFDTVGANEMGVTAGHVSASHGVVVDSSKNVTGFNQVTSTTFSGIFSGALSSSAQIASNISGSLSNSAIGALGANIVSASVLSSPSQGTVRLALNGVNTDVDSGLQSGDSPTFAGGTITGDLSVGGTLTAQEVHTEFESASILFTSGSTQFGNSSDDVHEFKGNLISGSSTSTASLAMISLADKIEHIGDTNNTIEFGTDEIKLRTGGGSRLIARDSNVELYNDLVVAGAATFNEDSGDKDFRVESNGNTHMLFVDGGANSVGIGTTAPSGALHVNGANPTVFITNSTQDGASTLLRMTEKKELDGNAGGYLLYNGSSNIFQIGTNISSTDTPSITLLRDGSGNVGVGEVSPITHLDVRLDSTSTDLTADYAMFINNQTGASTGRHATMGFGTYNNGGLTNVFGAVAEGSGAQSGFTFLTHNGGALAERVRIANDGKVGVLIDGTSGLPSSSLHIRANEPNIILQDMNHAPASSVAFNANSSTAGLEIGADVQNKYSSTTISFQVDGTERVKFEDGSSYVAEFKGDVKILDNNSDPRLLIGDSTSANEYGEVSYDSSENELRLGIQGNEDTIVLGSDANVVFKSMITATIFRTDVTTTSVANATWTNISGLTSLGAGLYIVHVYKDNYAANDWSARGIVEATGHSTIDGDFENQTGFQLRVNGSDVQLYHTLGSTFGITARWIKIG